MADERTNVAPARPWWWHRHDGDVSENTTARTWTSVGTIDGGVLGSVDPAGLVSVERGWSIDWWIGAEDRWYLPAREASVRQMLVDDAPVVETAMRVPGGDVVHRCFGAAGSGGDSVVIEVENRTPVPVALALVVRPYDLRVLAGVRRLSVSDNGFIIGAQHVAFLRPPALMACGSGDVTQPVVDGEAGPFGRWHSSGGESAEGAWLWPLPHGTTVRIAMAGTEGAAVPSMDGAAVARGWSAHVDSGCRASLPDGSLARAVEANRRHLLLHQPLDGSEAGGLADVALAAWGHVGTTPIDFAWPRKPRFGRRRKDERDLAAQLLTAGAALADEPARTVERIGEIVVQASSTWAWSTWRCEGASGGDGHDPDVTALFLLVMRELLVRVDRNALVLLSAIPEPWKGAPIEVHDAPTAVGLVSFAVRWHGERPALLWEVAGRPDRITCPALDPTWSTTDPRGEALLQAVSREDPA